MKGLRVSRGTEFKKGIVPHNHVPVGTVRIRKCRNGESRAFVKTKEGEAWPLRSIVVWEKEHGPVPRGLLIHHVDGNPLNDSLTNLAALSRAAHLGAHRHKFKLDYSKQSGDLHWKRRKK